MLRKHLKSATHSVLKNKPSSQFLVMENAPRSSSRVIVMPIPSITTDKPTTVNSGWTQSKATGLSSAIKHVNATHKGSAIDSASPMDSTFSLRVLLLPELLPALQLFDELPQRKGWGFLGAVDWATSPGKEKGLDWRMGGWEGNGWRRRLGVWVAESGFLPWGWLRRNL